MRRLMCARGLGVRVECVKCVRHVFYVGIVVLVAFAADKVVNGPYTHTMHSVSHSACLRLSSCAR